MPKIFLFELRIGNKPWKTRNLVSAQSSIKTQRTEDRKGNRAHGEFLRYDNNNVQ